MLASCSLDDTFKFNCATHDTFDAVKMFLKLNLFFIQISPPYEYFTLNSLLLTTHAIF